MSMTPRSRSALIAISAALFFSALAITPSSGGTVVAFSGFYRPGTIVVRTKERKLYLVFGFGRAMQYPVGVGRAGRQWAGSSFISGKFIRPNWKPPADVRHDSPDLPDVIPSGSPSNPMGVAAMTLAGSEYAIHGTNSPKSIGGYVSYGCIRMFNKDVMDLYRRVWVGTPVVVMR
jgi:lipoprotein-anchoring transpeptidase ErfK/SrfK